MSLLRRRPKLTRGLDEAECYRRCHGARWGKVRIVGTEIPRPPVAFYWARRVNPRITGEELRRQLLARLEARKSAG